MKTMAKAAKKAVGLKGSPGVGERLVAGFAEALAHAHGEGASSTRVQIPAEIDVAAIRKKLGMTQKEFAEAYDFDLATLRNYEQGRRVPVGPARTLLRVIAKKPKMVRDALLEQA